MSFTLYFDIPSFFFNIRKEEIEMRRKPWNDFTSSLILFHLPFSGNVSLFPAFPRNGKSICYNWNVAPVAQSG
jgi:hypothetical protein